MAAKPRTAPRQIAAVLPADLLEQVQALAAAQQRSVASIVRLALAEHLAQAEVYQRAVRVNLQKRKRAS